MIDKWVFDPANNCTMTIFADSPTLYPSTGLQMKSTNRLTAAGLGWQLAYRNQFKYRFSIRHERTTTHYSG